MPGAVENADDIDARIAAALDGKFDAKLNAAISGHLTRHTEKLSKAVDEKLSKLIATLTPNSDAGTDDGAGAGVTTTQVAKPGQSAANPELAAVLAKVNTLTQQISDERKKRIEVEDRQRKTETRTAIAAELERKGIKGLRAQALLSYWEQAGVLKSDDDGKFRISVKRARDKGMPAEELVFEDFGEAVDDWAQSPEAQEFMPVATAAKPGSTAVRRPATQPATRETRGVDARRGERTTRSYDKPANSNSEATRRAMEQLEDNGLNLDNLADLLTTDS